MNSNTNGGRNNNKNKIFGGTVGTRNRHQGSPSVNSEEGQTSNENGDGSKSENDHWPLTPAQAFKLYERLSDYEHGEILEYPEIYCTGALTKKSEKIQEITMDMTTT